MPICMFDWGQGELNFCNKNKPMTSEIDNQKCSNANQLFYNVVINVINRPKEFKPSGEELSIEKVKGATICVMNF